MDTPHVNMFDLRVITCCYKRVEWNILLGVLVLRLRPVALDRPPRPAGGREMLKSVAEILEYVKGVTGTSCRCCVHSVRNQYVTLCPCLPGSPDSPLIPLWPCRQRQQQQQKSKTSIQRLNKWQMTGRENRSFKWCSRYLHARETRVPVQSRGTSIRTLKNTTAYLRSWKVPATRGH